MCLDERRIKMGDLLRSLRVTAFYLFFKKDLVSKTLENKLNSNLHRAKETIFVVYVLSRGGKNNHPAWTWVMRAE